LAHDSNMSNNVELGLPRWSCGQYWTKHSLVRPGRGSVFSDTTQPYGVL